MLNFLDPVSVGVLTVLRDDEDARTFYVLPDQPAVAPNSGGVPDFLFLMYLKDLSDVPDTQTGGGGYVQFRTVLSLTDADRNAVLTALRTLLTQEQAAGKKPFGNPITITEPVLAAPLWTSGTVDLSTFAVSDTGLVTQATDKAPVDLTGDLGASFAATLSADGAGVFEKAFNAYQAGTHELPLVITYNLTYAGRISAKLTIDAKHSVVHDRVWQHATPWQLLDDGFVRYVPLAVSTPFTLDLLPSLRTQYQRVFPMIPVDEFGQVIDETISDSSVTVAIDEVSTGDPATDAANRASLLKLATDLLTQSLMPALTHGAPSPGATDAQQTNATTSLLQLDESATPGTATFHLELNDAMSVVRQASPNAPLQVLIDNPATLSSCFHVLRLADDFFKSMDVAVSTSGVDFSTSGIQKVHAYYQYSQVDDADPAKPTVTRSDDGELAAATDVLHWRWDTARAAGGGHKERYQYRADIYWQNGTMTAVPWTPTTSRTLIITPPVLGAVKVDAVLTAPPGTVDSARVDIAYTAANGTAYQGGLELTPTAPRASWLQPTGELSPPDQIPTPPTYRYTITYRTGPTTIVMQQRSAASDTLEVPTPFVGLVGYTLMAQGTFDQISSIAGTVTYTDAANHYTVVRPFVLSSATTSMQLSVPLLPGGPRTATYTARVEHKDGTFEDLAPGSLTEGLNFIGSNPAAALRVDLHTDLLDFAADLKAVQVTLRYTHADGSVTTAEPIFTAAQHTTYEWLVARTTADPDTYAADVTFYGIDRSKDQTLHLTNQTATSVELDRSMATS